MGQERGRASLHYWWRCILSQPIYKYHNVRHAPSTKPPNALFGCNSSNQPSCIKPSLRHYSGPIIFLHVESLCRPHLGQIGDANNSLRVDFGPRMTIGFIRGDALL